jgi:dTDP-4-dehydrorhamnose reductase
MKILLFGKNGQVGWELQRSLAPLGELIALGTGDQKQCGDLANLEGIAQTVRDEAPDVIVNAAAYTAVDKAESEPEKARRVNAEAPYILALEAKKIGALLVHYSTDYVFDGSSDIPWLETDVCKPINTYGMTKREGEIGIQSSGCRHLIFRSSWIFAARGNNFAKTMLRLAKERDHLKVINDQIGAPTGADFIADITAHAVRQSLRCPELCGLYHLASAGETSWFDYARFVLEFAQREGMRLKVGADAIAPLASSEYPTPAKRPLNSRLDTAKLTNDFDVYPQHWSMGVDRMLHEMS